MMDALGGLGFDADKMEDGSVLRPAAASQPLSRLHKSAAEDDMQVIDISEDSDSDGMAAIDDGQDDDSDLLHRPLSPSNPFLVICNSLCSSPSSAASIHVHPSSLSLPPPSKQDTRIPISSLPDDLRCFLIAQQYALVRDCEAEGGLLPSWMTADHVKLLSQLFDKHVKSEWEEMERGREGAREREERAEREEAQQAAGGPSMKEKEASLRGAEKLKTAMGSVSTSQASSSISSSSSFSASSSSQQQPAPIYSLITASDPNASSAPPSSPHASSYTPPRQLPSTPVPPPLLSPSLSKQTSRIAETIRRLYGLSSEEKGHKLLGHSCLTADDQSLAAEHKSDLLYGEVLPEGVSRMFDSDHLDLLSARTVYDLGSGLGKLAMQAYLQYPHLDWVCGVELARSRSMKGFEAVRKLSKLRLSGGLDGAGGGGGGGGGAQCSSSGVVEEGKDGQHIRLTETMTSTTHSYSKCLGRSKKKQKHRYLELRCADLFTVQEAAAADVVVCETKFPEEKYRDLAVFLSHFKPSVRVLTYEDLDVVYSFCHMLNPYVRYDNNHVNDRFYTTWAPNYGYRFHLWRKRGDGGQKPMEEEKREEKQFKQE